MDTSYRKVFIFNKTYVLFVASDILILSATNDRSKNKNKRTNKPTPLTCANMTLIKSYIFSIIKMIVLWGLKHED